jgi:hypothetical protein
MIRYLLLFDIYGLVFVGRPLWQEDGVVFYTRICCWALPAQSFSGPSPLNLATIFYCLRFEISRFVASYDSQGHGGGIRPHLHTGATAVVAITPRHWPHRKHRVSNIKTIVAWIFVASERVYRAVAQKRSLLLESPISNGSIRHVLFIHFINIQWVSDKDVTKKKWINKKCRNKRKELSSKGDL